MNNYVLIVAGGKGSRMGNELPKQFIPIGGKPILMHTLEAFHQWNQQASLIVVLPEEHQPYWTMLCRELGCPVPHRIANGGETRFHSVQSGLQLVDKQGWVAIHDGVRPFVSEKVIADCFAETARWGAVIPVVPLIDSIRQTTDSGSCPVDRQRYVAVQTPQVFDRELILKAYGQPYNPLFTDDASVVEAMGVAIHCVAGNRENLKITDPFDLLVAEALLSKRVQ